MNEPRHVFELRELYAQHGTDATLSIEEALILGRHIVTTPEYMDAKHPQHARAVDDANLLYEWGHLTPEDQQ